jgi:PKD repeat protein
MVPVAGQTRTETGIVNVDPLFIAPVSGPNGLSGDYRLAFNSPVIDIDSSTPLGVGETDIRGLPRIVDGAAPFSGPARDLGAYEYQRAAPVAIATATPATARVAQAISFSGAGSTDVDGDALTYAWTFDDGASATGPAVSHAFSAPGSHVGTLAVSDASGRIGTKQASVTVTLPATTKCKKKKRKKHSVAAAKKKKCKKKKQKA